MCEHSDHCIRYGSGTHPDYEQQTDAKLLLEYIDELQQLNQELSCQLANRDKWAKAWKRAAKNHRDEDNFWFAEYDRLLERFIELTP